MVLPPAVRALAFACLASLGAALRAAPWPEVDSDLPTHPDLKQGTLGNGLRYAILPHEEPKNRVSLRLMVAAGSLHENDDERGLAHFVEHMVFRGTKTHPAGSLTTALQRLGVSGPDSNAFTFLDHTTYHLELPDATEATLREGCGIFREYASEATFETPLIELERGVVISELDTRDVPGARAGRMNQSLLWPKSRPTRREPGGLREEIRQFTRAQFVAFYDAWYRPERMAIVVVGDVDPAQVERILQAELGGLAARGEARPEPADMVPEAAAGPDVQIFSDPGIGGMYLSLQHPVRLPRERDTHARRVELLHQSLALGMLQLRLQNVAHTSTATFNTPVAQLLPAIPGWSMAVLSAGGKIDEWQKVAADLEQEHRRAFQFGFSARELELTRTALRARIDENTRTYRTWPSSWLAGQLAEAIRLGNNFPTPAETQRDLTEAVTAASLSDCAIAFRKMWTTAAPSVFITANPALRITREGIATALNASRNLEVKPLPNAAELHFAYTNFGPPGKLVREEHLEDLDVRLSAFSNQVLLNFKATTFDANTVHINVRIGEGKLSQPPKQPGIDLLAAQVVPSGGVGRHTAQELGMLLAGAIAQVNFSIEPDACVFQGACSRQDLALCLQIIAAYITDPAYRPEAMRDTVALFGAMYTGLDNSPSGPLATIALRDLAGGDARFGTPPWPELAARTIKEVQAWLAPQFKRGAIEVAIAGHTTWEEAVAAVSSTLGALPKREPRRAFPDAAKIAPPRPPVNPKGIAINPKFRQSAVAWYWPVEPVKTFHEERRCRLLAAILNDRCRLHLREQLGATYTPQAAFFNTPGFPGLAYFSFYAEMQPTRVNEAMKIIDREATSLMLRGVTEDEFERARQPFLSERDANLRQNSYWCRTVLASAQTEPIHIAAARDRASDTAAITASELSELAKHYLDPGRSFRFVTVPLMAAGLPPTTSNSKPAAGKAGQSR